MTVPFIQPIEGQGGNISIYSSTVGQMIVIQVRNRASARSSATPT